MLLQELPSWCASGETRTWLRNKVQLPIAFWQSSRFKLGVNATTSPLRISQGPALLLPPSQERIPYPHTFIRHQHEKVVQPTFCSMCIFTEGTDFQRCCSYLSLHFLHLVGADWANGKDGSTETLAPLEDGCGGIILSPLKTLPSQGREMQLNVLHTQPSSAIRPVSCHLSESQRQEKTPSLLILHMAFKGLGQCNPASSLPNERGGIYTQRSRTLGWKAAEDFGPGLLHWPRQAHLSLSALVMGQSLEVLSRHRFSCCQRLRRFSPSVLYSLPEDQIIPVSTCLFLDFLLFLHTCGLHPQKAMSAWQNKAGKGMVVLRVKWCGAAREHIAKPKPNQPYLSYGLGQDLLALCFATACKVCAGWAKTKQKHHQAEWCKKRGGTRHSLTTPLVTPRKRDVDIT